MARPARWSIRILSVGILAFAVAAGWITVDGLTARARPADVAIVLGSKVNRSGKGSPRLHARLDEGRRLYERGMVRRVLVSGATGAEGFDESDVMRRYLVGRGVPDSIIVMDPGGANTFLTARDARRVMEARRWETAVVVTQYFHITRSRFACERAGIRVVGASAPRFFEWRDAYSLAREVVGLGAYALGYREGSAG